MSFLHQNIKYIRASCCLWYCLQWSWQYSKFLIITKILSRHVSSPVATPLPGMVLNESCLRKQVKRGTLSPTLLCLFLYPSNTDFVYLSHKTTHNSCIFVHTFSGVSRARLVCTGIVLIGLFISLEPVIWSIDQPGGDGGGGGHSKGFAQVVWPFVFTLGFLPLGILNTLIERELKTRSGMDNLMIWTPFVPTITQHFRSAPTLRQAILLKINLWITIIFEYQWTE